MSLPNEILKNGTDIWTHLQDSYETEKDNDVVLVILKICNRQLGLNEDIIKYSNVMFSLNEPLPDDVKFKESLMIGFLTHGLDSRYNPIKTTLYQNEITRRDCHRIVSNTYVHQNKEKRSVDSITCFRCQKKGQYKRIGQRTSQSTKETSTYQVPTISVDDLGGV